MADPDASSSTDSHHGAAADQDVTWFSFIDDNYPHLLTRTHFYPPFHFNRTPYTEKILLGERVHVTGNPDESLSPRECVDIPESMQEEDRAKQRCLSALSSIPNQVMMVVSGLRLEDYLDDYDGPGTTLPSMRDPSFPKDIEYCLFDILLIHRHNGLLIGEVRSVGRSSYFQSKTPREQTAWIKEDIEKTLELQDCRQRAIKHLVGDLPPVRLIRTAVFPNLTSSQLRSALHDDLPLQEKLCQGFGTNDVDEAMGLILCKERMAQPMDWWQRLHSAGTDPTMTDNIFKRLVARFCGPITVIEVPSVGPYPRMLRSWAHAVAETGWRLAMLRMTPSQVDLITRDPEPQYLYLQGPPGTGKTICIFLKALQWVQQGRRVVCVSGGEASRAETFLLMDTLNKSVKKGGDPVQLAEMGLQGEGGDTQAAVSALHQQMGPGPFSVIVVALGSHRERFLQWLTEMHDQLPSVPVWTAGVYRVDKGLTGQSLPPWLKVQTSQEALRCPPTVTTHLQRLNEQEDADILPYIVPQHPVPTQGPPVQQLQHRGQPGHSGDHPWQCEACGDILYDILNNELRLGHKDPCLQHRDIFILYAGGDAIPSADDVMVQQIQRHGLKIKAMASYPLNDDDTKELALASIDVVTAVSWRSVQGLERRVVIALDSERGGSSDFSLSATCLCTSALYTID